MVCLVSTKAQLPNKQGETSEIGLRYSSVAPQLIYPTTEKIVTRFPQADFERQSYLMLQFEEIPSLIQQKKLAEKGIFIIQFVADRSYIVRLSGQLTMKDLHEVNAQSVAPIPARSKLAPALQSEALLPAHTCTADGAVLVLARYFQGIEDKLEKAFDLPYMEVENIDTKQRILRLALPFASLETLAALPYIESIHPVLGKPQLTAFNGRGQHNVEYAQQVYGLTGSGVTVGVGDQGKLIHADAQNRVINYETDYYWHGSMIAGVISGAGNIRESYKGMAPGCTVITDFANEILDSLPNYYSNHGMVLTNNAYKFNTFDCAEFGNYNVYSGLVDQQLLDYPDVLHVFSSANDALINVNGCNGYPPKYATLPSFQNVGKNVLTVGGIRYDNTEYLSSSRGPATDGRLKPEIVAKALNVYGATSVNGNANSYSGGYGTSFAVPTVVGVLALMYEQYKKQYNGIHPPAALMKSIACNTADDVGNPGPDFLYGYGRINAEKAISVLENEQFFSDSLAQSEENTQVFIIPPGLRQARIMLYWADVPGSAMATKALVNDLDISLVAQDGTMHLPWVLDASPTGCLNDAVKGIDTLNNMEQITLDNPPAGTYILKVEGSQIPVGKQIYHINYLFVEDSVEFSYPIGGEGLRANAYMYVYWNSLDVQNDFALSYSLDDGANWMLINDAIAGADRYLRWTLPTVFSDQVRMKMTQGNNTTISERFSISKRPSVTATAFCNQTVEVCWDAIPGAEAYQVYQLAPVDTFIQAIDTVCSLCHSMQVMETDTSTYWYSVRALFNNKQAGERAYATKIDAFPANPPNFNFSYVNDSTCYQFYSTLPDNIPVEWDFGDGTTDTYFKPEKEFAIAGNYTVCLRANFDCDTIQSCQILNIDPPNWTLSVSDMQIFCNDTISFTPQSECLENIPELGETVRGQWFYFKGIGDTISLSTCHPTTQPDTRLHVFEMNCGWTLLDKNENNSGCVPAATLSLPTTLGQIYRVLVSSRDFEEGNITLSMNCAAAPDLQIYAMLEGPYNSNTGRMNTRLKMWGILPGQIPVFPAAPTPPGQPYNIPPWNHEGTEGSNFTDTDYASIAQQNNNMQVVDWVLITFSEDIFGEQEVHKTAALLLENGKIVFPETFYLPKGATFYLKLQHRNHLGALSRAVSFSGNTLSYDFYTSNSMVVGSNYGQLEIEPGVWGLYAGDGVQDDNLTGYEINGADKSLWLSENGTFGTYLLSDYNLDGGTNGGDKVIWSENNGVYSALGK